MLTYRHKNFISFLIFVLVFFKILKALPQLIEQVHHYHLTLRCVPQSAILHLSLFPNWPIFLFTMSHQVDSKVEEDLQCQETF